MILEGKQKILFVLEIIKNENDTTPNGESVVIGYLCNYIKKYVRIEYLKKILKKLQDENIIKFINYEKKKEDYLFYLLIDKNFSDYFINLKKELGIKNTIFELNPDYEMNLDVGKSFDEDRVYWIEYSKNGEILLNGVFSLAETRWDSVPQDFFQHLYDNPRTILKQKDIEGSIGKEISREMSSIIHDLGFSKNLLKVFFRIRKKTIYFRNPVTRRDLNELKINQIKITAT